MLLQRRIRGPQSPTTIVVCQYELVNKFCNIDPRTAKREDFEVAYKDDRFWRQLDRVKDTYPDDGGRDNLNELVGNVK